LKSSSSSRNSRKLRKISDCQKKKNSHKNKPRIRHSVSCSSATLHIKKRVSMIFKNNINDSVKEKIQIFNDQLNNSLTIIKDDLDRQSLSFKSRIKANKEKGKKNDRTQSVVLEINQVKRKISSKKQHRERTKSHDNMDKNRKNGFFQKFLASQKSQVKIKPINNVFNRFLNNFHFQFLDQIFENCFRNALEIVNNGFQERTALYLKTEDYVKELELTFGDELKDTYHKSVSLMCENVNLERENEEFMIKATLKRELQKLNNPSYLNNLNYDSVLNRITLDLAENLFKLIQ